MAIELITLTTIEQMLPHLPLIQFLYPKVDAARYTELLTDMLQGNYRQLVVFENGVAVGLAGFWVGTKIYSGKYLEPDNVIVHPQHRNKGIGKLLTDELEKIARTEKCELIMLDAYVENFGAHRFYYREGYVARGKHFLKLLNHQQLPGFK